MLLLCFTTISCKRQPQALPFLSPDLDVVVTDSASTLCIHRDGEVEYILYYGGPLINWSWNGDAKKIEEPQLWLERGHLELSPSEHFIGVLREGVRPSQLFLNGRQFGIFDQPGRVFLIRDSQTIEQLAIGALGIINTEEKLEDFSERLRAFLASDRA